MEEPSSSKNTRMHAWKLHGIMSSLVMEFRQKHSVFSSGVHLFGLPTFETHTFGALPFGFTSALNVKYLLAFVVQTTLHWHVMEAVVFNLMFAALTSLTFPMQSGISLPEMIY